MKCSSGFLFLIHNPFAMSISISKSVGFVCILLMLLACGQDKQVSDTTTTGDGIQWTKHGLNDEETRYSPLSAIDTSTVGNLKLQWRFSTGMKRGIEASPLVIDSIMYFTGPWSVVFALDIRSGKEVWRFDPEVDRSFGEKACCDVVNRGVAYASGKIYLGALDGRLIALDAHSGEKIWETLTVDQAKPYTITGAPRVVKDKVIIGNGGAELGVRGYFSAYDTESGAMKWRFYTVPGDPSLPFESAEMETAAKTWTGEWWKFGGGGTVWDAMAYDGDLDMLYVGTGNGSPWDRNKRSPEGGDNLFLSSILALDPDDGRLIWHYQTTPGDSWDFTATQHMILADLEIKGEVKKVLMQAPKNGFFYVLDRTNGQLISAEKYTYVNWADSINIQTGRPIERPLARYNSANIDIAPNFDGGHNWQPMAYNKDLDLVYIPARETFSNYGVDLTWEYNKNGWGVGAGWNLAISNDPKLPTIKDEKARKIGKLIAWDPIKQQEVWHIEQNNIWNGGLLTTAGYLVFQGTADGYIRAYHAKTGALLWVVDLGTGIMAPPITYEVDGVQFLTVITGWGGGHGMKNKYTNQVLPGTVYTFSLQGNMALPKKLEAIARKPVKTTWHLLDFEIQQGAQVFYKYCNVCHVVDGSSGGVAPNLAYSPHIGGPTFEKIVIEGQLLANGMPSYKDRLDEDDVKALQAFIMKSASGLK